VNGRRIADGALEALRAVTTSQLIVANDAGASRWFPGERVVADALAGLGPLAGIETALLAANGQPVLVLAWDMPFVHAGLLREIAERGAGGARAVVPRHGVRMQPQPLCAYYPASARDVCRELLERGERRAAALAEALPHVEWLRDAELEPFGDPGSMFMSIDTPEQLAAVGGALP